MKQEKALLFDGRRSVETLLQRQGNERFAYICVCVHIYILAHIIRLHKIYATQIRPSSLSNRECDKLLEVREVFSVVANE